MVVLPAPSSPRIKIHTSLSPQSLLKRLLKRAPEGSVLVYNLILNIEMPVPISYESRVCQIFTHSERFSTDGGFSRHNQISCVLLTDRTRITLNIFS